MKTLLAILIAVTAGHGSQLLAGLPTKNFVPVEHVYVPHGYDSNDLVEIVVEGMLPNLCHKAPTTEVTVEGNKVSIKVESLYYAPSNPFCPPMIVPFLEIVTLGNLKAGSYEIEVNAHTPYPAKANLLVVATTSQNIDEHTYASVEYIEQDGSDTVVLKGFNPSFCFELDRVAITDNGSDTYSLQPIMKQVSDFCPMKLVPFEIPVKLPTTLTKDVVLVHVRSMNGKSVNTLLRK